MNIITLHVIYKHNKKFIIKCIKYIIFIDINILFISYLFLFKVLLYTVCQATRITPFIYKCCITYNE